MKASPDDEVLRWYRSTWRNVSLVPSTFLFVGLACLSVITRPGWPRHVLSWVLGRDPSRDGPWLSLALFVLHLHALSPMLAWGLGRRLLYHRAQPPVPELTAAYRSAPRSRSSWWVTGSAPWWAAGICLASLLGQPLSEVLHGLTYSYLTGSTCDWSSSAPFMVCFVAGNLLLLLLPVLALLPHSLLFCFWWNRAKRDASRAGILEHVAVKGAALGCVVRTLADQRPASIVAVNVASRRLRLSRGGALEVWLALDPIDDLAPMVPWRIVE